VITLENGDLVAEHVSDLAHFKFALRAHGNHAQYRTGDDGLQVPVSVTDEYGHMRSVYLHISKSLWETWLAYSKLLGEPEEPLFSSVSSAYVVDEKYSR